MSATEIVELILQAAGGIGFAGVAYLALPPAAALAAETAGD